MNLKPLSLQAIDKLLEFWATDTAKSVAESREESAAVVEKVFAPVIDEAESKYKPVMLALEGLTPGGSEFVGDVERCVAHIRDWQSFQHNLLVEWKRKRDDAERRLGLARDALQASSRRRCWMCRRGFSFGRNSSGRLLHEFGVGEVADYDYCHAFAEQDALAQLGAPSQTDDDEPHPEFIRGYLAAADDLAEPYPASMSFFASLTKEQIEQAVAAMGGDISGRLHAHWARHWARNLRKRIADGETA